jgi:hypothetical protein
MRKEIAVKDRFVWIAKRLAQGAFRDAADRSEAHRPSSPLDRPPFDFDALNIDLARGLSRREAFRRLGLGIGAGLLAEITGLLPWWPAQRAEAQGPGGTGGGPRSPVPASPPMDAFPRRSRLWVRPRRNAASRAHWIRGSSSYAHTSHLSV